MAFETIKSDLVRRFMKIIALNKLDETLSCYNIITNIIIVLTHNENFIINKVTKQ